MTALHTGCLLKPKLSERSKHGFSQGYFARWYLFYTQPYFLATDTQNNPKYLPGTYWS